MSVASVPDYLPNGHLDLGLGNGNGDVVHNDDTLPLPDYLAPALAPVQDLNAELPVVLNDLIPLSSIVQRVVAQAYAELANLAEMCAPLSNSRRKWGCSTVAHALSGSRVAKTAFHAGW